MEKCNLCLLKLMACKVVLVGTPISHLVGKIAPYNAIFKKWQLEHTNAVVEVLDGLVGYDHTKNEEEKESETCASCQYPVLHDDAVSQSCYRGDETQVRHQMVEEHQSAH